MGLVKVMEEGLKYHGTSPYFNKCCAYIATEESIEIPEQNLSFLYRITADYLNMLGLFTFAVLKKKITQPYAKELDGLLENEK